jgi:hypothetical protein
MTSMAKVDQSVALCAMRCSKGEAAATVENATVGVFHDLTAEVVDQGRRGRSPQRALIGSNASAPSNAIAPAMAYIVA